MYTDKSVDIDKVRGAVDRAVVRPAEDEAARIVAAAKEEAAALLNEAELRKAELVTEIAEREGELEDVMVDIEDATDRLSAFGKERTGLRETLRSFDPSLPRFGAGKMREKLSAAQSSIQSLLDAQERREQLEEQLRSLRPHLGADASQEGATHRARLDDVMREATEVARAAKALSRNHVAPTNSRPRGQVSVKRKL